ncbi:phosphatidate cytidylyltransferase [Gloeocapsopsis crepidinum LEGE 06123]|uniref:Phosphatidate cytidylyltransferase n=1 Tax=Gloeocapsopsis crepidinum LEGE 06123 TaxID=588587 RepID=A0ABR9USM5_9CHRO|nr:diacylglycerol/polyprenol kinase family protein [Gloeocapsopsis crepidinum]MBE9191267.1 phosphatidate cytidylyltransferase [Gloeocapsopsis crepidinum LEGE 06123]
MLTLTQLESVPLWQPITVVGTWVGAILLIALVANRYTSADSEITRKIVHIGTGNIILFAWWLDIPASIGIGASVVASIVTLLSYKFPLLPGINSVGRQSLGTFFYAVSIGVLVAWFWSVEQPQYAALGILVMTWGDGLAALVGQRFGKHRYKIWGIQKSWEGSLTMTIVSYIVSSLIFLGIQGNVWQTWLISLVIALVATTLEAFSKFGIDNLTVPLGSAAIAFALSQLL